MPKQPNIIFYFSDQQRWDTVNETLTPNLMRLAEEGILYENNFTCQPVCGPARACLQTGEYATQNGCYWNGIPLKKDAVTLADHFNRAGYETAYVGKWHLASDRLPGIGEHYENTAVPEHKRGGYRYWRAADVLEFTSHGYGGYIFDNDGNRLDFEGYRADAINGFAEEYLANEDGTRRDPDKPFFLFISQLEPHHQNDHKRYEGYKETVDQFKDYPIPEDLTAFHGDYKKMFPDYLSAINRLDYNVGHMVELLKELGLYEDTIILYTSDHGSHFKTRNAEYKRSCHEASIHTPLIISGGGLESVAGTGFVPGTRETRLTSLIDLPTTLLAMGGIAKPKNHMGNNLLEQIGTTDTVREAAYVQVSEASNSRAIRTERYKYAVKDFAPIGYVHHACPIYYEDYLYDLAEDPHELHNLVKSEAHEEIRAQLREQLLAEMKKAGEWKPVIRSAVVARKK